MSIKSMMPSSHLILCRPLLLLPPSLPASGSFPISQLFVCMRWQKYWSFSFSISPSSEYSGMISLRIKWLDLLAVQGTLKSLLKHQSSKVSILQCSAFFTVQLSHDYWKNYSFDLYRLLSAKCVCFLICCLGWSLLFFTGASIF